MSFGSIRFRLTLWNMAILAFLLSCFAIAVHYSVRWNLTASIDQELQWRAAWETEVNYPLHPPRFAGPPRSRPAAKARNPVPPFQAGDPFGRSRFASSGRLPPDRLNSRQSKSPSRRVSTEDRQMQPGDDLLAPGIYNVDGRSRNPWSRNRPWDRDAFERSVSGSTVKATTSIGGAPYRLISDPIRRGGRVVGVIQLVIPISGMEQLLRNVDRTLWILLLPGLTIAGLCGALLTDRSLRPVRRISQTAAQLAAKDLSLRLPVIGNDEFSELSANFNRMMGRLEGAFETLETTNARLEAAYERQRRFTADASHELRTPLTTIRANTSLALSGEASLESYHEALQEADGAADTMSRIVDDLLFLARSDNEGLRLHVRTVPAQQILESAVSLATPHRIEPPVRTVLVDSSLQVTGDPHHLGRLLRNLIENAVRHTPPDGTIEVSARSHEGSVALRVEDTGNGIAPEHLPRVFDRFYRVDDARSAEDGGAGLGLSICQSIARAHAGTIEIESRLGEGTAVTVVLPNQSIG